LVGGFTVDYFWIVLCDCSAYWSSPIGLVGGYALIVLAFIQYWFDKKKLAFEKTLESSDTE
jgi:hypothetical protein